MNISDKRKEIQEFLSSATAEQVNVMHDLIVSFSHSPDMFSITEEQIAEIEKQREKYLAGE